MARASADLIADYGIDEAGEDLPPPSWNIAPTTSIPIIVDSAGRASTSADEGAAGEAGTPAARVRRLAAAKWGLVPPWANDASVGIRAFNARSETAAAKPTFRTAVARRRAVVPASGYYEWHTGPDKVKQPHFIFRRDGDLLMAALYEWWRDPAATADSAEAPWLLSASILTREATGELANVHHRMPVFLDRERMDEWLDPAVTGDNGLVAAIAEHGAEVAARTTLYPVDRAVGDVRSNGPHLLAPLVSEG
ncbi:DUF159 family protein [Pseudoclavibacter endophyticus]|nr:DUF159 family protein [Pseudoclavibacter endophyticus]